MSVRDARERARQFPFLGYHRITHQMARARLYTIKASLAHLCFLTTLAFWLRSSVVSVLNSLTTIMEAPPPFLVILFLPPQLLGLCLHPSDAMTLPLHYWLVSSGDPFIGDFSLCCSVIWVVFILTPLGRSGNGLVARFIVRNIFALSFYSFML